MGWFTTKYPVALEVGGLTWAQVVAGDAALGAVIKDAKEQLRALPDGLTYGLLRYLNPEVDLDGADPPIGFNYLGRQGATTAETSGDAWQICWDGLATVSASVRLPMPLMHTLELNAGTVDTDAGPCLRADVDVGALGTGSRAGQPVEPVVVRRPGRYLRACARRWGRVDAVGYRVAGLSQEQIDELQRQYADS